MMGEAVVVRGLNIVTSDGSQRLVEDACFDVALGEILGLVGESGSGKTTLGLALLHHCRRGLRIDVGTIRVGGRDLRAEGPEGLRQLRGRLVCYVPQDPATSLNPALRVGTQLAECLGPKALRNPATLMDLLTAAQLPATPQLLLA